jgi:hypothetical protein
MSHCRQHAGRRGGRQSPGRQDICHLADSLGRQDFGRGGLNHGPFGENFMVANLADTETVLDT